MINSLFSSFDPISGYLYLNYLIWLLILAKPFYTKIFLITNKEERLLMKIFNFLNREVKMILNNKNLKDKNIYFLSIFFTLLILNLMGLIPYVFRITSHLAYTFTLACPLWLRFLLFNLKNSFRKFFRHLVPTGTPMALSHFIVLIETVRQLIRPITLSVRLAANITAGHILITLIRNTIFFINFIRIGLLLLFLLELAVAFIQRYVFTLLLIIYIRETTYATKSCLSPSIPQPMTLAHRFKRFQPANQYSYNNKT